MATDDSDQSRDVPETPSALMTSLHFLETLIGKSSESESET